MPYIPEMYIHDLDKWVMKGLDTIPEWGKIQKLFDVQNAEKRMRMDLLSKGVQLNECQMPNIYNLLTPICKSLNIQIPELYYLNSEELNAYTMGVSSPLIVITSGLVESLSLDSLEIVLAHECGHIACKHNYYLSLKRWILDSLDDNKILRKLFIKPVAYALLIWNRCCELSADRACLLYKKNYIPVVDTLLSIHGYDEKIDRQTFVEQAIHEHDDLDKTLLNKFIYEAMCKDEDHPRLSVRVYECYRWASSKQFAEIIEGNYTIKESKKEVKDIAKVMISLESNGELDVDKELERVNKELEKYTSHADFADYAFSIAIGAISGFLDATFVGKMKVSEDDINISYEQVNHFIQWFAEKDGYSGERLSGAINRLEKDFEVLQDDIWKGKDISVSAKNHHLADLAHHPTPVGLLAALVVQFLRVGVFVSSDGKWHFECVKTSREDLKKILIPLFLTGTLNWIVAVLENNTMDDEFKKQNPEAYKYIRILNHSIASLPILIESAKCLNNWFGHMVSDMGGSKNTPGQGMGIPGVFISMLYELSSLSVFKNTGLPKYLNDLYVKDKIDLRHEIGIYKTLGLQTIPVVFMEVFIRFAYFIVKLITEVSNKKEDDEMNWSTIIPIHNRTVDQMIAIANLTFTMTDTADAAVHAATMSAGNWILFAKEFSLRFNYIGAGKTVVSVVKEVSNESKEEELIHEKLILMHEKSEEVVDRLEQYKAELESLMANFLVENIQTFISGFDYMEQGLEKNDSDLIIQGNVTIQEVLGRKIQFKNQEEFDDLMDSDEDLVF